MELIYLLKIFKEKKLFIFLSIVFFLLVSVSYYFLQPEIYEASLNLYVKRKIEPVSDKYYSYDGYYASQVGKEYTDTVLGFFETLEVLKRAGEITEFLPQEDDLLIQYSKNVTISKEAPQIIKVSVKNENSDESKAIVKALCQAGIERVFLLNQTGDPNLSVDVVDSEPIVIEKKLSPFILTGLGFCLGLIFSISVVLIQDLAKKLK